MAKGRRKREQGPEQLAKQAVRSLVRGKRCKPKGWDDNMDWKFEFPNADSLVVRRRYSLSSCQKR